MSKEKKIGFLFAVLLITLFIVRVWPDDPYYHDPNARSINVIIRRSSDEDEEKEEPEYYCIREKETSDFEKIGKFKPDRAKIYHRNTKNKTARAIIKAVLKSSEHQIFDIDVWQVGERYFVYYSLNVNLWLPCELYECHPDKGTRLVPEEWRSFRLEPWAEWNSVDLLGIQLPKE